MARSPVPSAPGTKRPAPLRTTQVLNCWGYMRFGQLARGCDSIGGGGTYTAVPNTTAAGPVCLNSGPNCTGVGQGLNLTTSFAVSEESACAISNNRLFCWGANLHGEFGD